MKLIDELKMSRKLISPENDPELVNIISKIKTANIHGHTELICDYPISYLNLLSHYFENEGLTCKIENRIRITDELEQRYSILIIRW